MSINGFVVNGTTHHYNYNALDNLPPDTSDIYNFIVNSIFDDWNLYDTTSVSFTNNTAVTNNNDGTYTFGTTDYGRTIFGSAVYLKAGQYLLSGVGTGRNSSTLAFYISKNEEFGSGVIASNDSSDPKIVTISSDSTAYLGIVMMSKPAAEFTVRPFLCQAKTAGAFKWLWDCPIDLNSIEDPGFYDHVSTERGCTPLPNGYIGTRGLLINLPYAINKSISYGMQILFDSSIRQCAWMRLFQIGASSQPEWQVLLDPYFRSYLLGSISSGSEFSLSGNYFDVDKAEWLTGYDTGSGVVVNNNYRYAFAELHGPGDYIRVMNAERFGNNTSVVRLYDENKNVISTITATRIGDTNGYQFSLDDLVGTRARYTTIGIANADPYPIAGLYFNSDKYPTLAGDMIPKPNYKELSNPLYKSVFVCDGDSIAQAALDKPYYRKGWWGRIVTDYSCTGKNYAIGGGTICDFTDQIVGSNPRHCIALNIDAIHSEYSDLDYLILDGGTNDADLVGQFNGDTPPARFGTWTETNFSGSYDTTTFCGAVESLFYKALSFYPKAKIGFIIPMEMGTSNTTVANRRRYFDEIVKIAKKWHIPVLDLWNESQLDARLSIYYDSSMTTDQNVTAKKCYNDGQHPTSYGYDLMQGKIDAWINSL